MRAADLVTALVLAGLGGVVIFDALRLGIGWGTDGPKSGFFPFWLAVIMVGTCLVIAAQSLRTARERIFVRREQLRPVLAVLVPAIGLVVLTGGISMGEVTLVPALGLYV